MSLLILEEILPLPLDPRRTLQDYPFTKWDPVAYPLTLRDFVGLPFDPLGPCRPTPSPPGTLTYHLTP